MALTPASSRAAAATTGDQELAYAELTGDVSVTATLEATPTDIVSAGAVVFDGATRVCIEFFARTGATAAAADAFTLFNLWDGATNLGYIAGLATPAAGSNGVRAPVTGRRFLTPSAATHTYKVTAFRTVGNGLVQAGAGGIATSLPAYIRITSVDSV